MPSNKTSLSYWHYPFWSSEVLKPTMAGSLQCSKLNKKSCQSCCLGSQIINIKYIYIYLWIVVTHRNKHKEDVYRHISEKSPMSDHTYLTLYQQTSLFYLWYWNLVYSSEAALGWRVLKTPTSETLAWLQTPASPVAVLQRATETPDSEVTWPRSRFNTSGSDPLGFDWEDLAASRGTMGDHAKDVPALNSLGIDSRNGDIYLGLVTNTTAALAYSEERRPYKKIQRGQKVNWISTIRIYIELTDAERIARNIITDSQLVGDLRLTCQPCASTVNSEIQSQAERVSTTTMKGLRDSVCLG